MKASFHIGDDYEVEVYWSFLGLEIYSVNGKEVLRKRSRSIRGTRKFVVVGDGQKHEVEIKIDLAPTRKSWILPGDWIAHAYVDGELVVADLSPHMRRTVRLVDNILNWLLVVVVSLFAVVIISRIVQHMITR